MNGWKCEHGVVEGCYVCWSRASREWESAEHFAALDAEGLIDEP